MSFDPEVLLREDIQTFIRKHENADVSALALKKPPESDWPYPTILDQIKSRQKAKSKLPTWFQTQGVIFPAPDLIEQASSEATANYKSSLFTDPIYKEQTCADLTAGCGIDIAAFARNFSQITAIDNHEHNAQNLRHNLPLMTNNLEALHIKDASKAIHDIGKHGLIYIDPQRRDNTRKGFIRLQDYSPNVIDMLSDLKTVTDQALIKTSPMLDLWSAAEDLKHTCAIHIVEWQGECKEILFHLDFTTTTAPHGIPITCAQINDDGTPKFSLTFTKAEEDSAAVTFIDTDALLEDPDAYCLYEPCPALLKAGAFKSLSAEYGLQKLHPHTHLYVTKNAEHVREIGGRWFKIHTITDVNRKSVKLKKANLSIRNFPDTVDNLRKKLKLKDGGSDYLFACTLDNNKKYLLHTHKAS